MEEHGDAVAAKLAEVKWRHGIVSMTIRARGLGLKRLLLRRLLRVQEQGVEWLLFIRLLRAAGRTSLRQQERRPLPGLVQGP